MARQELHEKFRFFEPNPAQAQWINEIGREGAFIVINGGGNGSGKTYGLIAVIAAFAWPDLAPKCFALPTFQSFNGPKKAWIVSNPAELGETGAIQAAIDDLWPKHRYRASRKSKQYDSLFKTDTGWSIELKSTEQDEREFRGSNIGFVGINEPIPENIFKECIARTRKGGVVPGALTSLYDQPWIVDGLLNKANGKDIRVVYGDVELNCKDHAPGGTLSHENVERILAQYDPDEREARKTGKPLTLSGRIFKGFDRNVHVAKEPLVLPDEGVTIDQALDPAIGKPVFAIWSYVDPAGVVHIYREYPEFEFQGAKDSNLSVKDYVEIFKQMEDGRTPARRILDRHFGNARRTMGGLTLKQEFSEAGMDFIDSYHVGEAGPEVETGILKVKEYLRYDSKKEIDALNRPRIIISPTCKNVIAGFERWSRNPDTGKPKEEFKDPMDVVRYLLMSNPEHEVASAPYVRRPAVYGVDNT